MEEEEWEWVEKEMATDKIGTSSLSFGGGTRLLGTQPLRIKSKLGPDEREILWILGGIPKSLKGLQEFTGQEDKPLKRIISRLENKHLVEKTQEQYHLTNRGKGALLWLISQGRVWIQRPFPKVKTKFKLVAFDLDDTLIPGFVSNKVNTEIMRELLQTLKQNKIKTAVLSINTPEIVIERLRKFGLAQYIDYPVFTDKAQGVTTIKSTLGLTDDEILMIGHDWSLDWFRIKDTHPAVQVAMLNDVLSGSDSKSSKRPEGVLYIDRTMTDFLRVLRGEISEESDKQKLVQSVNKKVSFATAATGFATYTTLRDDEILKIYYSVLDGKDPSIGNYSDETLGKLRFLLEEKVKNEKDISRLKNIESMVRKIDRWNIKTVPFQPKQESLVIPKLQPVIVSQPKTVIDQIVLEEVGKVKPIVVLPDYNIGDTVVFTSKKKNRTYRGKVTEIYDGKFSRYLLFKDEKSGKKISVEAKLATKV